jgi:SET domain-containing protein
MRQDIHFDEAPRCGVGQSTLCQGQGLFALRRFEAGDLVADYSKRSKEWRLTQHEDLSQGHRDSMWWIGLDEDFVRVANPESLFMRANHSSSPNTDWNPKARTLKANQVILPGEEITYDYRKEIAPESVKAHRPEWAR